ncbi:RNA polymerase sigma factor [Metabacillus fastidiosus]|uniref:RNA polymerase sigma factor n=1 Tax=Metabacillus fastidiosus TaxID=1458 RepID=UPI003D2C105C
MSTATINAKNFTIDLLNSTSMKKIFAFELFKVNKQDKEDVKQNCVVEIMKALKKQNVPAHKLPSFCQTIIKRTVVDYYRYSSRMIEKATQLTVFSDSGSGVSFTDIDSDDHRGLYYAHETIEHGYEITDIRADFELNRHKFTPTEQAAIDYVFENYEKLSMDLVEIAEELNIHKSHTSRAFKKLRAIAMM